MSSAPSELSDFFSTDAPPDAPDRDATNADVTTVSVKSFFTENGRSVRALLILSHGLLSDDGTLAFDVCKEPWSKMKKKTISPNAQELKKEIIRRWNVMCAASPEETADKVTPRPAQWPLKKVLQWLEDNPINDSCDREYLLNTINERVEAAKAADAQRAEEKAQFNKKWIGPAPILRLIHTLIDHDEIKRAYLKRFDVPSDRMALENRNTPEAKASTAWAMMSDKWNDPSFSPSTVLMGHLHSDFSLPIMIDHDVVSYMALATPEKVKEKWAGLIHECKREIEKWERSGQGDGGYDFDDEEDNEEDGDDDVGGKAERVFGALKHRSQRALDSRSSFFVNKEPYLLYLWEVLDIHDLLVSSMQRLNSCAIAANGADGIPSVIGDNLTGNESISVATGTRSNSDARRGEESTATKFHELTTTIRDHGNQMVTAARMKCVQREKDRTHAMQAAIRASIHSLNVEKRQMTIQLQSEKVKKNKVMETVYSDAIREIEQQVNEEEALLIQTVTTPQKSNRSPKA